MTEIRLFEVRYLGRAKTRADGSQSAFGFANGSWSVAIPKDVLQQWFGITTRPGEAGTLYNTLGIAPTATADEVKKAYRRMAKQWHPDACHEPDAKTQFIAIQHAYDILSNGKRTKYDAGLALQASLASVKKHTAPPVDESDFGWRSPLRCGHIMGEGARQGNKFVISKILNWSDIFNPRGEMLVVSWIPGGETYVEAWVKP